MKPFFSHKNKRSMTLEEAKQYLNNVVENWTVFNSSHKVFIMALKKVLEDKNQ